MQAKLQDFIARITAYDVRSGRRPWLVAFRPFVFPCAAREELERSRFNKALDQLLDDTWAERDGANPRKASGKWPAPIGPQQPAPPLQANVAQIAKARVRN